MKISLSKFWFNISFFILFSTLILYVFVILFIILGYLDSVLELYKKSNYIFQYFSQIVFVLSIVVTTIFIKKINNFRRWILNTKHYKSSFVWFLNFLSWAIILLVIGIPLAFTGGYWGIEAFMIIGGVLSLIMSNGFRRAYRR